MKLLNKNIDRRGCALVATYNAAQWVGADLPYETVRQNAIAWCGFRGMGLSSDKMTALLRSVNIPAKRVRKGTSFQKTLSALFNGHAVVFTYTQVGHNVGHAVLVTPKFKIANPDYKYKKWNDLFEAICNGSVSYNAWIVGKQ